MREGIGKSQKAEKRYTRGRFAKMNNISAFTLRLYDRMGILKPEYTNEKGYHFYSDTQCHELLMINLCIKSGFSLKEIRQMQTHQPSAAEMSDMLTQIKKRIHEQVKILASNEKMVEGMLYYHSSWEQHGLNQPFVEDQIAFHGFASEPFLYEQDADPASSMEFIRRMETRLGHPMEYPLSYLADWEEDGSVSMRMFLRTNEISEAESGYLSFASSSYLIVAVENTMASIPAVLAQLNQYAAQEGFTVQGSALLTPVQKYLFSPRDASIIYVTGIPIRRE